MLSLAGLLIALYAKYTSSSSDPPETTVTHDVQAVATYPTMRQYSVPGLDATLVSSGLSKACSKYGRRLRGQRSLRSVAWVVVWEFSAEPLLDMTSPPKRILTTTS